MVTRFAVAALFAAPPSRLKSCLFEMAWPFLRVARDRLAVSGESQKIQSEPGLALTTHSDRQA